MKLNPSLLRILRLLCFRLSREEFLALNRRDLAVGLLFTWLAGMGRYWDDPGANVLQHLGLGSLIYVFVLSGLLWVLLLPFWIPDWRYERLITFVSMTALPALSYAIPVERMTTMANATEVNGWFLAVVASWRVALLVFFLKRAAGLTGGALVVGTLFPMTIIVTVLTALNLERAVFEIMRSFREVGTSHDGAYLILVVISNVSLLLFIPLLLGYLSISYTRYMERKKTRPGA